MRKQIAKRVFEFLDYEKSNLKTIKCVMHVKNKNYSRSSFKLKVVVSVSIIGFKQEGVNCL